MHMPLLQEIARDYYGIAYLTAAPTALVVHAMTQDDVVRTHRRARDGRRRSKDRLRRETLGHSLPIASDTLPAVGANAARILAWSANAPAPGRWAATASITAETFFSLSTRMQNP